MARAAIVACIALLLAAMGWLFVSHDDPPPLAPLSAANRANEGPAAPVSAAPTAIDASAAAMPGDVQRTSASLGAVADAPPLPADATWVEVVIVDKATKEPVPAADAWWTDGTQGKLVQKLPRDERDALQRDQDAVAERFGWRTRSDEAGRIRVSLGKDSTRVMARAGTRFGETWVQRNGPPPSDGYRVLLAEDVTLLARVLDHAGRPATGVPLALVDVQPDGKLPTYHPGTVATGDDGIASFKHVQQRQRAPRGKPVEKWAVRVVIHKLDVAPVFVDAQAPPVDAVEVKLPPTGRLAVRLTFEGKQVPGFDWLGVRCGPVDDHEAWNSVWTRRVDDDGFARFPYVPVGQTFVVSASSQQGGGLWDLEVDGPRGPDQEVARTLELAGDVVALTGRLLDGDGAPLAEQTVSTRFGTGFNPGNSVTTDGGGRFLWIYKRVRRDQKEETKLEQLTFERQVDNASPQRVTVAPGTLAIGRNDLGDLRFGVATLVVSGRFVFDSPGSQKASFWVERLTDRPPRNEPGGIPAPGRAEPNRPDPGPQWRRVSDLQLATQGDGAFEARGTVEAGRYRVRINAINHLPVEPVEFVPGASDVQIAIRRGNELAVKCRLPDGVEAQRVLLDLTRPGAPRPAASSERMRWPGGRGDPTSGQPSWGASESGSATYRWPAIEPGAYTLHVGVGGFAEALATIADVVVPPPEGGDPRLQDLDLRSVIGTLRIRAQVPEGVRTNLVAIPQPQPGDGPWQAMGFVEETVLPVPQRPFDLLVATSGCRPATLRSVSGTAAVTLEPWPKVEVRFSGLDALPPGAVLRVSARDPAPAGKRPQIVSDSWMGSVDSLLQPASGSVTVKDGVATLRCGDTPRNLSLTLALGESSKPLKQFAPNEIAAGAGVTVQLSADEIRAVVDELKKPQAEKK